MTHIAQYRTPESNVTLSEVKSKRTLSTNRFTITYHHLSYNRCVGQTQPIIEVDGISISSYEEVRVRQEVPVGYTLFPIGFTQLATILRLADMQIISSA